MRLMDILKAETDYSGIKLFFFSLEEPSKEFISVRFYISVKKEKEK
jgi:hypothetical protein